MTRSIEKIILATIRHQAVKEDFPDDESYRSCQIFLDADLCILGEEPNTYNDYAERIWNEYSSVYKREDYCKGRIAVLEKLKERESGRRASIS